MNPIYNLIIIVSAATLVVFFAIGIYKDSKESMQKLREHEEGNHSSRQPARRRMLQRVRQ